MKKIQIDVSTFELPGASSEIAYNHKSLIPLRVDKFMLCLFIVSMIIKAHKECM